ncbi:MAG: response regulator [Thermodesulfobacteriota bacterium]
MPPDYSKILVVDNAAFIRMVIRLRLQAVGVPPKKILEAGDGEEAYAILNAEQVGNILSDYEMDPMDGIQLAKKLFLEEKRSELRFVLFSGTPPEWVAAAMAHAGVEVPLVTKVNIRESWGSSQLIGEYFPELAATLAHPPQSSRNKKG